MTAAMTEAVVTALVLLAAVVTVEVNVMAAAAAKAVVAVTVAAAAKAVVATVAAAAFPDKPDRHRHTPVDSYR